MNTASSPVRSHLLKLTLHDWPDADCLRILGAVRAAHAAAAGGKQASTAGQRLLIVDMVLHDRGPLGLSAASSDLQVMWPSAGAGGSLPAAEQTCRHAWPNQGHRPFACSDPPPLQMLALLGGKERMRQEWRRLLAAGGFRLVAVHPLRSTYSMIEAAPA